MSPTVWAWLLVGGYVCVVLGALGYGRWFMRKCPKCGSTEYTELELSYGCMEPGCRTQWSKDPLKICPVWRGCAGVDGMHCEPHTCSECLGALAKIKGIVERKDMSALRDLAHDLKQPLTGIVGFADNARLLVQQGGGKAETIQTLERLIEEARRLTAMLEQACRGNARRQ